MLKKIIMLIVGLFVAVAQAQPCSEEIISQKAMQAALSLEILNGGGHPLTQEIYSLNSQFDTYVVVLSYSGLQNIWKIKVESQSCMIESVSK